MHTHKMKWQEFRNARRTLGLDRRELASVLQVDSSAVFMWETGILTIPPTIGQLTDAFLHGFRPDNWPQQASQASSRNRSAGASVAGRDYLTKTQAKTPDKSVNRANDGQPTSGCTQSIRPVSG